MPDERLARHGFEVVADEADLTGWELAVVLTDHDAIDYVGVAAQVGGVFDTRGVYRGLGLEVADVIRL